MTDRISTISTSSVIVEYLDQRNPPFVYWASRRTCCYSVYSTQAVRPRVPIPVFGTVDNARNGAKVACTRRTKTTLDAESIFVIKVLMRLLFTIFLLLLLSLTHSYQNANWQSLCNLQLEKVSPTAYHQFINRCCTSYIRHRTSTVACFRIYLFIRRLCVITCIACCREKPRDWRRRQVG